MAAAHFYTSRSNVIYLLYADVAFMETEEQLLSLKVYLTVVLEDVTYRATLTCKVGRSSHSERRRQS